jgi:DUF3078 family protein
MKSTLVMFLMLVFVMGANAEDWTKSADLGLIVNQTGYSDEWAGDELGSFNWTGLANMTADRHLNATTFWKNTAKLSYGLTKNEFVDVNGDKDWADSEKSTDRIFLESMALFAEGSYVNPYVAVTHETQFEDMMDNFLLVESAGLGKTLLKNEQSDIFSRLGFAYRQHKIGGADIETDGGLDWVTDITHTFNKQLKGVSKLRVFKAFASTNDEFNDNWKTVDVAWEVNLSAAVSKYVQTTLFFELLYDEEINTKARWREVFGVGVTYKLF